MMWTKLPLGLWNILIIYDHGIFVILLKFWVLDLGDSRGYFGWKRPIDSKSLFYSELHHFWAEFNCLGLQIWCFDFYLVYFGFIVGFFLVFFCLLEFFWVRVLVAIIFKPFFVFGNLVLLEWNYRNHFPQIWVIWMPKFLEIVNNLIEFRRLLTVVVRDSTFNN